ncbi:MAG: preprotein translocase subunit SecG [Nitratireductor sp.]
METVIIVIHLMVVLALVGVVLLQRSEGGGLGIGGGSGFMSARGAANALTRATGILAAAFFATSIALGVIAKVNEKPADILDRIPAQTQSDGTKGTGNGILDQLAPKSETAPAEPAAPAAPAEPAAPAVPSGQ